jgi:hypothetical protein
LKKKNCQSIEDVPAYTTSLPLILIKYSVVVVLVARVCQMDLRLEEQLDSGVLDGPTTLQWPKLAYHCSIDIWKNNGNK